MDPKKVLVKMEQNIKMEIKGSEKKNKIRSTPLKIQNGPVFED